jgi:glucuronate isomerase
LRPDFFITIIRGGNKMKSFIQDDFLLNTEAGKVLFHDYAKQMPIYDYHCHLNPKEIAENKKFKNMTEIWLYGDHYKWRAMRSMGIDENYITGSADDFEKFQIWAKTVPYTIGNPLYHWTHLELKKFFDVDLLLNEETSREIWEHCNTVLKQDSMSTQSIIKRSNVKMIGTTDDPIDSLQYHKDIKENPNIQTMVLPSFRPDKALNINLSGFKDYINQMAEVTNLNISTYDELLKALEMRIQYFHEAGCRISDHAFETLPYEETTLGEVSIIFAKGIKGVPVTKLEEDKYKTFTMMFMGRLFSSLGWTMQLHIGAVRNTRANMFEKLGPDTGYDSINDYHLAKPLNQLLNSLDKENSLPKTIIYSLNPIHNYVVASAAGNFQGGGVKGKVQFGSGWWFQDQKDAMRAQMKDLANIGLLSTFIGMLTDSRSFLSYTRHEYFRRILCELLGEWVESGEAPRDYQLLGNIVQDICFNNAASYFNVDL